MAENKHIKYIYSYYENGAIKRIDSYNPPTSAQPTSSVAYAYLLQGGKVKKKTVTLTPGNGQPVRTVVYENDSSGRLWKIESAADIAGKPFEFKYDNWGRRDTLSYPNGVVGTYGYHQDLGWLTSLRYEDGVNLLYRVNYQDHDKVGNRKQKQEVADVTTDTNYVYDDLYQVKTAGGEQYDYDNFGNRKMGPTSKEPVDVTYSHNGANQMKVGRKFSYVYDDFGNHVSDQNNWWKHCPL